MYAVRRPVENVYLVREPDRRRTRELLALVLTPLAPMAVLFAAIWTNLETFRLGYQIERLQKQKESLAERQRQLEMERAGASALARVEGVARRQLGLVTPGRGQLVFVKDGVLARPAAAPRREAPALPEMQGPPAPIRTEEGF
ncbi:MAG: cell division protein FtsL [Thermoanaerobaculia bacterium]|nr:cell division protein FtsL [Thermoanaerobaculia bacterium]